MRVGMDLKPDCVEAMNRFLFLPDDPIRADVTIVLGMSLWQRPLDAALALYQNGHAGKLLFTGGHNDRIGGAEGSLMLSQALARGVDPAMACCENRATHTRENIAFSWNMIRAWKTPVAAINVVGIHYHIRRALLTARDILPGHLRIGHASYPSLHFTPGNWHLRARGRRDVLAEMGKLATYFPHDIPATLQGRFP